MTSVLRHLTPSHCLIYLDDIVVFSRNSADISAKLQQIIDRFRENNLKIYPAKSLFSTDKCKFLGHPYMWTKFVLHPITRYVMVSWRGIIAA